MKEGINRLTPGPLLVCLVLLVLYLSTASPSVGWRDGPEFADTSHTLGIAHPAGFPTFSLVSKLFTFLPLGSIPFRLTVFVALCGALCCGMLYGLIVRTGRLSPNGVASDRDPGGLLLAAAGTALLFGLSGTLWSNTAEIEVYTFHLLLLSIIAWCALRWSTGGADAWLYAGGLVYGLSAGNHATMAFYLPGLLFFVLARPRGRSLRRIGILILLFLIGFSVYIYLPVRSLADPPIDLGNPETWQRFLMHITDRKDSTTHFSGVRGGSRFIHDLWLFAKGAVPPLFWPLGLPLALVGLWRTIRADWSWAVMLLYIVVIDIVFFVKWVAIPSAYLLAYFVSALFCGVGAFCLAETSGILRGPRAKQWAVLLPGVLALVVAGRAWLHYPAQDRSEFHLSYEAFRDDFEDLPPDAVVISSALWFHHRSFQDIFGMRPDVTVLGLADFTDPDYFNPLTPEQYPRIAVPPGPYTNADGQAYLHRFLRANLDRGAAIFWEPSPLDRSVYPNLKPGVGFLFRFHPRPLPELRQAQVQKTFDRIRQKLAWEIDEDGLLEIKGIDAYYIRFLNFLAEFFRLRQRYGDAVSVLRMVEGFFGREGKDNIWNEDYQFLYNEMAASLFELGREEEAFEYLRKAAAQDPYDYIVRSNLGLFLLKTGRFGEAEAVLREALRIKPDFPPALFNLGGCYDRQGQYDRAKSYYLRALPLARGTDMHGVIEERLKVLEGRSSK